MLSIALQMLIGDKGKYLGVVLGLAMATFLMTQQPAIFLGILSRSYGILSDAGLADIWVMDPKVQFIDDVKPLQDTQLARVRSVTGVGWAVPFFKGSARVRLENGNFQNSVLVGLDDASLVGGPAKVIRGTLADLRQSDGIIVNEEGARNRLARPASQSDQPPIPLTVGDTIELNDRRAVVVGICEATPSLQSQPVIYTTYSRAKLYAPQERKLLSFILVKIQDGADLKTVATSIHQATGLAAYSRVEFERKTLDFFLKNTGIAINFGISAAIGLLIGGAIAGHYSSTLHWTICVTSLCLKRWERLIVSCS